MSTPSVADLDPFDLPDWVGEGPVSWATERGLGGHLVAGCLTGRGDESMPCDLLAVDQAWQHGQVLLLTMSGRATVATPGTSWTADSVIGALTRVARAVGADPARWSVRLGLS